MTLLASTVLTGRPWVFASVVLTITFVAVLLGVSAQAVTEAVLWYAALAVAIACLLGIPYMFVLARRRRIIPRSTCWLGHLDGAGDASRVVGAADGGLLEIEPNGVFSDDRGFIGLGAAGDCAAGIGLEPASVSERRSPYILKRIPATSDGRQRQSPGTQNAA